MASETPNDGDRPLGPTTTIHWKKWFYIAGAISGVIMTLYFGLQLISMVS
jgi:hypothetical protein